MNLDKKYDVVVIGGGTAGISAAYISAKLGLKTLVVEKNIHLGGSITSGLVIPAMKSNSNNINCEFYNDFLSELKQFDAQITYGDGNDGWINPELSKIALDTLLEKVDCDVIYNSEVTDVVLDNKTIKSIKISSNALSLYIVSSYFVDCTGNSNFSKILNCNFLENNFQRQPMSLRFHVSGVDLEKFSKWIMEIDRDRDVTTSYQIGNNIHLSTAYTWDTNKEWALRPIFEKGISDGILEEKDSSYFQLFTVAGMKDTVSLNCPRLLTQDNADPLDMIQTSNALITSRKQIWRLYSFMRKYFPGFENSYISNIADMLGIRESRRIEGEYIYTKSDLISGKKYDNPALHGDYPIDVHSYQKDNSLLEKTMVDYELPIEALIAKDYTNLYVAGRNLSADFEAQAALRIQKSCFSMGEAVAKHIATKLKLSK